MRKQLITWLMVLAASFAVYGQELKASVISSGGAVGLKSQDNTLTLQDLKGQPIAGEATSAGPNPITIKSGGIYTLTTTLPPTTPPSQPGQGPDLELNLGLEGFYDIGTGYFKTFAVEIEARTGGNDPETAREIKGKCLAAFDIATNRVKNNGQWETVPPDSTNAPNTHYYLVIKQKLTGITAGPSHLPIITNEKIKLTVGPTIKLNFTNSGPDKIEAFTPDGKVSAMKNNQLRAGHLNNDKIIDISDYGVWKIAVTVSGQVDLNNENSVIADINGDRLIDVTDYALWKGTVQEFSPGGIPQLGNHIYVPESL